MKWKYQRIGDVCTVERGGSPRPIDDYITKSSNGINWIKIGDTTDSMYITHTEQKIKPEGMKKSRFVHAGDFLLSNSMSFGRPYILAIDGCIHDGWLVLHDDENRFDKRFLYYYLSAPITYQKFEHMAVGGVVNNLNSKLVRNLEVPIPAKSEQEEIADKLDQITRIISNRQHVLTLLDELVKSRFVEMFGDPVLNPKKWKQHQLNDEIIFLTSGSRGWSEYFSRDGEIFITIKNVKNGHITLDDVQYVHAPDNAEAKRTKVQAGDLLISITADLGRTGVVSEALAERGAYINQHLTCVRLNRNVINPEYAAMFMESAGGKRQFDAKNQVGVKAGLNFEAIKSLKIMVPPLNLQTQFSTFVHQVEAAKTSVRAQLAALTTLRAKMMQEFFG